MQPKLLLAKPVIWHLLAGHKGSWWWCAAGMRAHQFTIKTLPTLAGAAWVESAKVLVLQQRSMQHGLHQLQTQPKNAALGSTLHVGGSEA